MQNKIHWKTVMWDAILLHISKQAQISVLYIKYKSIFFWKNIPGRVATRRGALPPMRGGGRGGGGYGNTNPFSDRHQMSCANTPHVGQRPEHTHEARPRGVPGEEIDDTDYFEPGRRAGGGGLIPPPSSWIFSAPKKIRGRPPPSPFSSGRPARFPSDRGFRGKRIDHPTGQYPCGTFPLFEHMGGGDSNINWRDHSHWPLPFYRLYGEVRR